MHISKLGAPPETFGGAPMGAQVKSAFSGEERHDTPPLVLRVSIQNLRLRIAAIERQLETLAAGLELVVVGELKAPWNDDSEDKAHDGNTSRLVQETEALRERCAEIEQFIADLTRSIAV